MANWGDPWGVSWSGQAEAPKSTSGGVYSGFVQSEPGKQRKKPVNSDDELNNLVESSIEGLPSKPTATIPPPPIEPAQTPTDIQATAEAPFVTPDSDDDEAIVLLLAA